MGRLQTTLLAAALATAASASAGAAPPPAVVKNCPSSSILSGFGLSGAHKGHNNITENVKSASACCALCTQSADCKAWSWHPPGTHVTDTPTQPQPRPHTTLPPATHLGALFC